MKGQPFEREGGRERERERKKERERAPSEGQPIDLKCFCATLCETSPT